MHKKALIETHASLFTSCAGHYVDVASGLLGKGAYAHVYRATRPTRPGHVFAIKFIPLDEQYRSAHMHWNEYAAFVHLEPLLRQTSALSYHLVGWHLGTVVSVRDQSTGRVEKYGANVFDALPPVTLESYLREGEQGGRRLAPELVLVYGRQLAQAVSFLHRAGVAHGDIKPENVAIDEQRQLLFLFDLGFASIHREPNAIATAAINPKRCTPLFAAPEVLLTEGMGTYNPFSADVWTLGQLFYCLMESRALFACENVCLAQHKKMLSDRNCVGDRISWRVKQVPFYARLLADTLAYVPVMRRTAAAVSTYLESVFADVCAVAAHERWNRLNIAAFHGCWMNAEEEEF